MTENDTDTGWSASETIVLQTVKEYLESGRRGVLATVIRVEGSAYRRPGAKMLVPEEGSGVGHITAGCLEDEVDQLAREVLDAGEPRVERYDLMEDEGDVWGLGVGCNGIIDVLLEPIDETYRPAIDAFEAGDRIGVLTVVDSGDTEISEGGRAYYAPDTESFTDATGIPGEVLDQVAESASTLVERGRSDTVTVEFEDGTIEVFIDGIEAPPELVVFGTGHDLGPVVELGAKADFRVTVIGFRGGVDLEDRFPAADTVHTTSPPNVRDVHDFSDRMYTVLATHNFIDDRLTLDELVQTPVPYIGLMGPRERFEEMREEFQAEDRTFTADELEKIYTPVGIDLGGGAPYQIALSIVGEALAVRNDREPKHLKDREGTIHERLDVEEAN